jgi:hypothetical protein
MAMDALEGSSTVLCGVDKESCGFRPGRPYAVQALGFPHLHVRLGVGWTGGTGRHGPRTIG